MGDVVMDRFSYVVLKKGLSPRYDPRLPRVPLFARPENAIGLSGADGTGGDTKEDDASDDDESDTETVNPFAPAPITSKLNPALAESDLIALAWRFERAVSQ